MNTTVLFTGGLMLGILVTLTIVSHMGNDGDQSRRPASSGRSRVQPSRGEAESGRLGVEIYHCSRLT